MRRYMKAIIPVLDTVGWERKRTFSFPTALAPHGHPEKTATTHGHVADAIEDFLVCFRLAISATRHGLLLTCGDILYSLVRACYLGSLKARSIMAITGNLFLMTLMTIKTQNLTIPKTTMMMMAQVRFSEPNIQLRLSTIFRIYRQNW